MNDEQIEVLVDTVGWDVVAALEYVEIEILPSGTAVPRYAVTLDNLVWH
jgi:hypothetical protein